MGENDAGLVLVVFGLRGVGLSNSRCQKWHQDSPGIAGETESGDIFGAALAAGDFNGDGIDDLAVGAPFESSGTASRTGVVHVLNGSTAGLTAAGNLLLTQDSSTIADAVETNDHFGFQLVAGDFNRDGRDDLAISAPAESLSGGDIAGVVHLLNGSAAGLTATGNRMWSQDSTNVGGVSHQYGFFGGVLAAGDFDGDGAADLAIGSSFDDPGVLDAGSVNVLLDLDAPFIIRFP